MREEIKSKDKMPSKINKAPTTVTTMPKKQNMTTAPQAAPQKMTPNVAAAEVKESYTPAVPHQPVICCPLLMNYQCPMLQGQSAVPGFYSNQQPVQSMPMGSMGNIPMGMPMNTLAMGDMNNMNNMHNMHMMPMSQLPWPEDYNQSSYSGY
jgi:hypothetical protein